MLRTATVISLLTVMSASAQGQDLVIQRWLLKGPIESDTGATRVVADYIGGEADLLPTIGDEGWIEVETDAFGRLDLNAVYEGRSTAWSAAYAHTYVFAPKDRTVLLIADSDDDLVVRINGQRVWVNEVARGMGRGTDTLTVKLSEGWNSVLLKPLNRSGGFGLLGRLSPAEGLLLSTARPPGMVAHNHPEPSVTVGPLFLDSLVWEADGLFLAARAQIAAWGPDPFQDVAFQLAGSGGNRISQQIARVEPGEPVDVALLLPFDVLRDAGTGDAPLVAAVDWGMGSDQADVFVDPARLLRLAGGRIAVGAWAGEGPEATPALLRATVVVPSIYDGLTLDLLPLGLGPNAAYRVNGREVEWREGNVELCGPCTTGDSLRIEIVPAVGRPLWMSPQVRVREIGYAEFADGYEYADVLTGRVPPIEPPDPVGWLQALSAPSEYRQLLARYEEAYAPLAAEIRRDTLHLVGNSHIDAAWLWPWSETRDVIRATWRTSLKLAEIFPGYIFTASSAAFYDMLDRLEPQLADSLIAAVEAGEWVPVGGWWVESDLNVPSGESLVRQGLYGQRYFERRFGFRSRVAWTPDCFGYPWTIPQILKGAGLDYFVTQKLRWNDSTEFPYNAFYWQGLDGSRVLTYNPYGYTHNLAASSLAPQRVEDRERTGINNQIVLYGVGDHGGGPTIAMLQRAEDLRRVPTFPTMVYADPLDALEAVEAAGDAELPVWDDELYLEYHRGTYTSQAKTKRRNRRSEELLLTAEALATVGTQPYPRERLEAAWRLVLFNQFHDILPGSSIPEVYEDAEVFYDSAWAMVDSLTAASFADLRARMDTRSRRALVVFNPLGWTRNGTITVSGRDGSTMRVAAVEVPAYGAKTIRVPNDTMPREIRRLSRPESGRTWIENAFLRVEVDSTTGDVVRIYDKESEREVLAAGQRGNVLQVFDDRPAQWDAWNIVITGDMWEVSEVRNMASRSKSWTAELEIERTWGHSTFRQTLVLERDSRYLDVRNEVDWREHRKALKVAFPLNVVVDSATYEIPYGTVGRTGRPRTQAERAKFEVPGQRWADVSGADYGVSILNDSKYGWDYKGNALRLTLLKSAIWPDSLADQGVHHFRYAVYPHAGDWRAAETVRRAAEYNTPLIAAFEPEHKGTLGREYSFASAEPANVEITSLKRAEDSERWVLRLVEWHGERTEVEVSVGCRVMGAERTNLLEDPGTAVIVEDDKLHLQVRPYEIATLLVECE